MQWNVELFPQLSLKVLKHWIKNRFCKKRIINERQKQLNVFDNEITQVIMQEFRRQSLNLANKQKNFLEVTRRQFQISLMRNTNFSFKQLVRKVTNALTTTALFKDASLLPFWLCLRSGDHPYLKYPCASILSGIVSGPGPHSRYPSSSWAPILSDFGASPNLNRTLWIEACQARSIRWRVSASSPSSSARRRRSTTDAGTTGRGVASACRPLPPTFRSTLINR